MNENLCKCLHLFLNYSRLNWLKFIHNLHIVTSNWQCLKNRYRDLQNTPKKKNCGKFLILFSSKWICYFLVANVFNFLSKKLFSCESREKELWRKILFTNKIQVLHISLCGWMNNIWFSFSPMFYIYLISSKNTWIIQWNEAH